MKHWCIKEPRRLNFLQSRNIFDWKKPDEVASGLFVHYRFLFRCLSSIHSSSCSTSFIQASTKQALVLHSADCVVCCVMRLQPNCFNLEMFDVTSLSCPGNPPFPVNMLFVFYTRSLINNCCVTPLLLIVGLTWVISTVCCCWSANESPMNSNGSSSNVFASLTTLTSQIFLQPVLRLLRPVTILPQQTRLVTFSILSLFQHRLETVKGLCISLNSPLKKLVESSLCDGRMNSFSRW